MRQICWEDKERWCILHFFSLGFAHSQSVFIRESLNHEQTHRSILFRSSGTLTQPCECRHLVEIGGKNMCEQKRGVKTCENRAFCERGHISMNQTQLQSLGVCPRIHAMITELIHPTEENTVTMLWSRKQQQEKQQLRFQVMTFTSSLITHCFRANTSCYAQGILRACRWVCEWLHSPPSHLEPAANLVEDQRTRAFLY